ncbi:YoaK family protein [uncultured Caulobacter sp.]|uniref:YoaK family protein n=1 Tax=uncultured Caulobacter sp. TaxID=158749 RepID=UPI00262AB4D5|nr:YoaK family protein [uncultured Caulobacter sp.]
MNQYQKQEVILAVALSGVAGYVDAIGFLKLGGFFVSFMSGNSTRLGVAVATGRWVAAATALSLVVSFVGGVVLGALTARAFGENRRSPVLLLEACLLAAGATLLALGFDTAGVTAVALAMGAENAVFQRGGDVAVGLTYMTGALVKAGQRIAGALAGGQPADWGRYVLLWIGLACGGALGALGYLRMGALALWPAVIVVLGAGLWTERRWRSV